MLLKKLNLSAKQLFVHKKINFVRYENAHNIAEIISKAVPFSKICILSSKKSFANYALILSNALRNENLRPINVCIENEKNFSIESVMGIFNIAEDVRYIVVTDSVLSQAGLYIATLKNLSSLFIVNEFDLNGITANSLLIENGKTLQGYTVSTSRTVAIDFNNFNYSSLSKGIALVGSKILSLIDYKINAVLLGKEENALLVEQVEDAIDSLLNLKTATNACLNEVVLLASIKVQLARLADEEFYKCSSAVNTALLVEKSTRENAICEYFSAKRILSFISSALNSSKKEEKVSNYNLIAERISNISGRDFNGLCKDILYKLKTIEKSGGAQKLIQWTKSRQVSAQNEIDQIHKLYMENGGEKAVYPLKTTLYLELAGYVGKNINAVTLIKEIGF